MFPFLRIFITILDPASFSPLLPTLLLVLRDAVLAPVLSVVAAAAGLPELSA